MIIFTGVKLVYDKLCELYLINLLSFLGMIILLSIFVLIDYIKYKKQNYERS